MKTITIVQFRSMTLNMSLLAIALFLLSSPVSSFHNPCFCSVRLSSTTHNSCLSSISRRTFCLETPTTAAFAAAFVLTNGPQSASAITSEAAKAQWKDAVCTIDDLLNNWSTIAEQGGDGIRTKLGTQGVTSPLFQIDKALKVLREDAQDLIEFTEQAEEFQLALSRADSMAYSANFAGGSGKPTPPAVYIEKSRKEVTELQKLAKALTELL